MKRLCLILTVIVVGFAFGQLIGYLKMGVLDNKPVSIREVLWEDKTNPFRTPHIGEVRWTDLSDPWNRLLITNTIIEVSNGFVRLSNHNGDFRTISKYQFELFYGHEINLVK